MLAKGPATYLELMAALGTRDGREILRGFDRLYALGRLERLRTGATSSTERRELRSRHQLGRISRP